MIQDPYTQTNDLNSDALEEVSAQELHTITGGCINCQDLHNAIRYQIKGCKETSGNATTGTSALAYAKKVRMLRVLKDAVKETKDTPEQAGQNHCQFYQQYKDEFFHIV